MEKHGQGQLFKLTNGASNGTFYHLVALEQIEKYEFNHHSTSNSAYPLPLLLSSNPGHLQKSVRTVIEKNLHIYGKESVQKKHLARLGWGLLVCFTG